MTPGDQSHTDLMKVMAQLLQSYQSHPRSWQHDQEQRTTAQEWQPQQGKGPQAPTSPSQDGVCRHGQSGSTHVKDASATRECDKLTPLGNGTDDVHAEWQRQRHTAADGHLGGMAQAHGLTKWLPGHADREESVKGCDGPVLLQGARSPIIKSHRTGAGGGTSSPGTDPAEAAVRGRPEIAAAAVVGQAREVDAHQRNSPPHARSFAISSTYCRLRAFYYGFMP